MDSTRCGARARSADENRRRRRYDRRRCAGGGAVAAPSVRAADVNLIERFTVSLDARCHVAVLRMRLSRSVPVGILVDGVARVPLGPPRRSVSAAQAAESSVTDVKIWDLTLSNGTELRPGVTAWCYAP